MVYSRRKKKISNCLSYTRVLYIGIVILGCLCLSGCGKRSSSGEVASAVSIPENDTQTVGVTTQAEEEQGTNITAHEGEQDSGEDAAPDTTVTIMIYMDASTLESGEEPFAFYDMNQMLEAELSGQIRVLIETGGTSRWTNEAISAKTVQRYEIRDHDLILLHDTGVYQDMTEADTLTEFIEYAAMQAPADRYILILWGHGRGPQIGYGMDDFQSPKKAMSLEALAAGIETAAANCHISFELIGFDACLMGNLETVYALRGCAEYLALSEDYEPAYGWQYTKVLNALSENSAIETVKLAEVIVDGFMEEAVRSGDRGIMAVVDTSYAEELMNTWNDFCETESMEELEKLEKRVWSDEKLLTPVPTSADGYVTDDYLYSLQDYDLTDMRAICELSSVQEAGEVLRLLDDCIIYVDSYHMERTMCGLAVSLE